MGQIHEVNFKLGIQALLCKRMKYKIRIVVFLVLTLIIGSCVRYKKYPYLISNQNKQDTTVFHVEREDYKLQPGDILDINVSSNVSSDIEVFNKKFDGVSTPNNNSTPISNYIYGYLINNNGCIDIPFIGLVKATGLTCNQLNDTIKLKLFEYINYANVTTKLGVFRITVLGEVLQPGTKDLVNQYNLNIFQAIGYAGDATDIANKKKVKLIRRYNDQTIVVKLDLSRVDMIASEYYYLQPNDVIYVEPLRAKVVRSNSSNIALALSALTFVLVLLNYIK